MRVLICGGRDYNDWMGFRAKMHKIAGARFPRTEPDNVGNYLFNVTIIAGGADGTDRLAASWAAVENVGYEEYKADWYRYGKAAGPIRNKEMITKGKPDLVIAFPGGKGTANMVDLATKAGIEVLKVVEHYL